MCVINIIKELPFYAIKQYNKTLQKFTYPQNLPAIIFGLPIMFLASVAPQGLKQTIIVLIIAIILLIVFLIILFRAQIFKKRKNNQLNN